MTMVIALCTSSAWAQSVISVGTNLDFSEGTPVDNGICTCDYDMEENNTVYSQMLAVTGWEFGNENGNNRAAGLFTYGSNHWLGGTGYNVPTTNPAGVAEGNTLGIVSTWGASTSYVQAVTLEAGDYVISVPVYNSVGGTSVPAKSLIGFIADNGTEYLAAAKTYPVDTWTVENIKFTLTETTTGKLTLGYISAGSGSGANQHLFFDKVEVLAVTETDLARVDLNAALVTAQAVVDAKAGVGAGLFMYSEEAYNTYAAAVAAAKAVSENAEATKDALVEALAALNAATEAYAVTAPAADAVYAVKFNGTDNYLTFSDAGVTIDAAVDTLSFEAVGNGKYYVRDNAGKYMGYEGSNKWTMAATADTKDEWTIAVNAEGLYTFVGKNGGIGVDGTEAGAKCYGDKNGSAVATWTIAEIVEDTPVEPEVPALIVWNINPSSYPAGVQYAVDETHVVNDTLTIYTTQMHWTTQLRVYSSSEHNGFFYSNKLPAAVKSIEFTAGNKKDVLVVYGSNDGATWTEAAKVTVPSTSYTSGLVADLTGTAYNYFKVDVEGSNQVRISNMIITLDPAVKLPVVLSAPTFSLNGCNLFAPATVELTAAEGTIYWSTDNETFVPYTEAIAIDASCTVYAYAEVDGTKSAVATAEYVMAATYDNVTALLAAEATSTGVPVIVKLTAVIDSLGLNKNGEVTSAFLIEGDDTLMIYDYNIPADYVVGNKVEGQLAGLWKDYYGTLELCNVDYSGATIVAPVTVESPWVGAAIENGQTYYLYNVKANAFMKGANAWGTQASFGADAVAFTAEGAGSIYALKSTYNAYLGADLYVDQAKKDLAFEEVGAGIYTIAKDGAYVAYTGANTVATVAEVNDGCYWQLLTADAIKEQMVAASVTNPYAVTALIPGANFGRNDQSVSAWTGAPDCSGDNDNFCAEKWNAGISVVSQTLTGLPNGTYKLQAQGLYRMGGVDAAVALRDAGAEIYDVKFFANADSILVKSVMDEAGKLSGVGDAYGTYGTAPNNRNHASKFFNAGYYEHEFYFTVTDGTATIGVANNTGAGADWLVIDNFRLTYYGTATVNEINKVRFNEVKDELDMLTNTCMSLYALGAVNSAYMAVSDSASAIASSETVTAEEINAYIPVMEAKIAEVKAIEEYYDNVFTPMNGLCYELGENSTPNTPEVFQAFDEVCALAGFANLYSNVTTIADLEALVDTLEDARRVYVMNAVPAEGYAFDYTFLAANPDMTDGTINGWTATEGWQFQSNSIYKGEGAELNRFQERWTWGAGLGNTSTMQTLANMPNGLYKISADIMATRQDAEDPKAAATGAYWVANLDSVAVATANNVPECFTVETMVLDGTITIGLVGVNTEANWMGLDNVKIEYYGGAPAEPEYLPIVGAKVGEVAIVEGVATVSSISTIDVIFDCPVALAENAGWATLADSWGPTNLNAEVLADNNCIVRFTVSADFNGEFTEAGDYLLNIPEGFIVGVENADFINAEITATITIEGAPVTPLAVVNVTVGEDVMADLSAVVATPEDMIKVNFDGQFYFQGMPVIVDAEGNDASDSFDFVNGLDFDGSNAYILMGKKAGIYTITLPKASFLEMMSWKAPAADVVLTVQIIAPVTEGKKVVYDLDVEREAGLGYAAQEYTIATSELAALLGVETLEGATIWGVNPDGSYVADAMAAYDGWRAVDGTFAGWSTETAAVCVKLFAEEAAYLISICTHGDNGNDPAVGTQSTASWALIAGVDTVVINTNITFVEPTVINIADYEVVSTITVKHEEKVGVTYSGNTALFDPISTAAALGVASLDEADQYILNVTTGNLVANSTDGWRDANGDAAGWGATGGVCVKIQQPSTGSIDYIGCYDTTHEDGEVYTAKWAFVHDGKAVVIEVVITFILEDGIENIESLENAVIYTISGTRVQGDVKSLERGIYIVNGRKMFVK